MVMFLARSKLGTFNLYLKENLLTVFYKSKDIPAKRQYLSYYIFIKNFKVIILNS